MTVITVKRLKAGMVLDKDVLDLNGRVLLKRGDSIEEKHFKILKAWGITEVEVDEAGKAALDFPDGLQAASGALEKIKDEMVPLFRHVDFKDPVTRELFHQCVERKLRLTNKTGEI